MLKTPARAGAFAAVITFLVLAVVLNVQARGWLSWYRLAATGQRTSAKIVSQEPKFHDRCGYEYSIDSHPYSGIQGGCELSVGQSVDVVYLPSEPSFSTMRSPTTELIFRIATPLLLALLAGLLSAWRTPRGVPPL